MYYILLCLSLYCYLYFMVFWIRSFVLYEAIPIVSCSGCYYMGEGGSVSVLLTPN
jgi:hypothetical protein